MAKKTLTKDDVAAFAAGETGTAEIAKEIKVPEGIATKPAEGQPLVAGGPWDQTGNRTEAGGLEAKPETINVGGEAQSMGGVSPTQSTDPSIAAPSTASEVEVTGKGKARKWRIGGQVFDSEDAAMAYADELDRQLLANQAYQDGQRSTGYSGLEALAAQAQKKPKVGDQMFERPEVIDEALAQAEERAYQRGLREIDRREKEKQLWDNFYASNQDLSVHKDLVQTILGRDMKELGPMQQDRAMQILAERTRGLVKSIVSTASPRTTLQSGPATVASASSQAPVSKSQTTAEKPVDFVSQVRSLGKKRVGATH